LLYFGGQFAQNQFFYLKLSARLIYVNADEIAVGVIIKDYPFRDFTTIHARLG